MKVLQTIASFGAKEGGTSTSTYDLMHAIHELVPEPQVDLLTIDLKNHGDKLMGCGEEWIKIAPNDAITAFGYSRNLRNYLNVSSYDIYHTNGLWLYTNHITCEVARKKAKPYVITPHGMLYPEALARSAWKKRLFLDLGFRQDIMEANCLHVTCRDELNHARAFGYQGPVALIGNPVCVPDYTEELFQTRLQTARFLGCKRPKKLGFLGRLHPRKKVENLLYGVSIVPDQNIEVYIIGSGDTKYEKLLKTEAKRLHLDERVHFEGFVTGRDKYELLAQLDALFVPSDMENFGMIIPEALICGTPVYASLGTPWEALERYDCGWWRDNSPASIAETIKEILSKTDEELLRMGQNGKQLIVEKYEQHKVAAQMNDLYRWLMGEIEKPDFVFEI